MVCIMSPQYWLVNRYGMQLYTIQLIGGLATILGHNNTINKEAARMHSSLKSPKLKLLEEKGMERATVSVEQRSQSLNLKPKGKRPYKRY